jgi:hypothetical protein
MTTFATMIGGAPRSAVNPHQTQSDCARSARLAPSPMPYFGWMYGSPPGLPGGGITGIRPPPTGGTAIPSQLSERTYYAVGP